MEDVRKMWHATQNATRVFLLLAVSALSVIGVACSVFAVQLGLWIAERPKLAVLFLVLCFTMSRCTTVVRGWSDVLSLPW